jgi:hypothetical protein
MNTILCPIFAMLVNTIVQIAAFRSRRGVQFFRSIVEGFLAGAGTLAVIEIFFAADSFSFRDYLVLVFLINIPIYLALSYCAYNFVQLGQTSIRIRMYSEIAASPGGINVEEMKREYDDNALIEGRIRRLSESGDAVERNGRYYIGRTRLLLIAELLLAAKRFLLGRESEFDVSE